MPSSYIRIVKPGSSVSAPAMRDCIACAGSGYYDDNGSPKCAACLGTGKEEIPAQTTMNILNQEKR